MTADDACFQAFHRLLVDHLYNEGANKIPLNKARKVFEDPRIKVYLADLTKTVSKKNVLSRKEVSAYRELESSGRLEHGIALNQLVEKSKLVNEDLEEQIASLDRSITAASEDRDELTKELDNIEKRRSSCMEKQATLHSSIVEMKHRLQESKCRTQEKCLQAERTVSGLSDGFADLSGAIQNIDDHDNLFAHTNLNEFLKAQDDYKASLTSFHKAYLNEVSQAYMNDLQSDNCTTVFLSGEDGGSNNEGERHETSSALARAEQSLPRLEMQSIEAKVKEASASSLMSFYDEKLKQWKGESFSKHAPNRQILEANSSKTRELRIKIDELREKEIPALVSQLTDLFKSHMQIGDYLAKSEYQQYITGKQKKVFLLLRHQHAMLDVVSILLSREKAGHEKSAQEIRLLCDYLHEMINSKNPEIEWLTQVQETSASTKRTLFSGKDLIALTAANYLSDTDYSSSFLHFDDLPLMADNHQKALKDLENSVIANEHNLKEIKNRLNECWSSINSATSPHAGVRLSQETLATWISTLETRLHELSDILLKSCDEIDRKKRLLKHDSSASLARSEWLEFVSKFGDQT